MTSFDLVILDELERRAPLRLPAPSMRCSTELRDKRQMLHVVVTGRNARSRTSLRWPIS